MEETGRPTAPGRPLPGFPFARGATLAPGDEPVVVRPASSSSGTLPIPARHAREKTSLAGGSVLDQDAIEKKLRESAAVTSLLAGIFEQHQEEPSPPSSVPTEQGPHGLDTAHANLLKKLSERESWSRDEYEALADSLALLPDGAREVLNDVAFDVCDDALIEGDDPVVVNIEVYKELVL